MSAPAIEAVEVDMPEFAPVCEGFPHDDGHRPPADYWVDVHGCVEKFACASCIETDRKSFAGGRRVRCRHCKQQFTAFEQAYPRLVPIR